jgi:hypothetical protein
MAIGYNAGNTHAVAAPNSPSARSSRPSVAVQLQAKVQVMKRTKCGQCCFSCVTCCGRIDYSNRKHRMIVAAVVTVVTTLSLYFLLAGVGQLLALNSTAEITAFTVFPDQQCGSTLPFSMTMEVNK